MRKDKYDASEKYLPSRLEPHVEPPAWAAEEIVSQLIRTLMFHPETNKLQSVDDISNDIQKTFGPQTSPWSVDQLVRIEFASWVKHYANMHALIDDPDHQKNYKWTQKEFDAFCPDWPAVSTALEDPTTFLYTTEIEHPTSDPDAPLRSRQVTLT